MSGDSVLDFPNGFEEIVKSIRFVWPGWYILCGRDPETRAPRLEIISHTPDSYDPAQWINVMHPFLVPLATYNERVWKAWIMERYCDVMRHEVGECLLFDGVREFGPHHGDGEDPYITWHIGDVADTRVRAGETREQYDAR